MERVHAWIGWLIVICLFLAWYFSWWPFLSGKFSVTKTKSDYNVFFYYPDGQEVYLGEANGLGECADLANEQAQNSEMLNRNWSYICCKITRKSSCATKER